MNKKVSEREPRISTTTVFLPSGLKPSSQNVYDYCCLRAENSCFSFEEKAVRQQEPELLPARFSLARDLSTNVITKPPETMQN